VDVLSVSVTGSSFEGGVKVKRNVRGCRIGSKINENGMVDGSERGE
jgi:hypothetical protein